MGFTAVALGAFGAHHLGYSLSSPSDGRLQNGCTVSFNSFCGDVSRVRHPQLVFINLRLCF